MPAAEELLRSLTLEVVGPDRFHGEHADTAHGQVFGGQLLAQSIVAALAGHDGKRVKTVHTVFARSARPDSPLEITVDRMHEGRSFASSTVTISQGDRLCTRSLVLLSADEPDFIRHADEAPVVAGPDASRVEIGSGAWEVRRVGDVDVDDPALVGPPDLDVWTRFVGVPDDPVFDQALIAFATDGFLISTAMRPHAGVGQAQAHVSVATGVVSHTLTFHEPCSAGAWLLLAQHSPHAGGGRSYGRADVFREDGTLVASFVQDGMIRPVS